MRHVTLKKPLYLQGDWQLINYWFQHLTLKAPSDNHQRSSGKGMDSLPLPSSWLSNFQFPSHI